MTANATTGAENVEGGEIKKSCCFFCHQNCGVLAYVKDNRVLKIEGDPIIS